MAIDEELNYVDPLLHDAHEQPQIVIGAGGFINEDGAWEPSKETIVQVKIDGSVKTKSKIKGFTKYAAVLTAHGGDLVSAGSDALGRSPFRITRVYLVIGSNLTDPGLGQGDLLVDVKTHMLDKGKKIDLIIHHTQTGNSGKLEAVETYTYTYGKISSVVGVNGRKATVVSFDFKAVQHKTIQHHFRGNKKGNLVVKNFNEETHKYG